MKKSRGTIIAELRQEWREAYREFLNPKKETEWIPAPEETNGTRPPENIIREEISEDAAMQMLKESVNKKAISEAGSWLETQEEKLIEEIPPEAETWYEKIERELKKSFPKETGKVIIMGTGGDMDGNYVFKNGWTPAPEEDEIKTMDTRKQIENTVDSLKELLIEKNKRYGNSALEPLKGIKYTPEDGIKIRLTDKLKRVINSDNLRKNDVADIMGYLTLLCVSKGWSDFNDLID